MNSSALRGVDHRFDELGIEIALIIYWAWYATHQYGEKDRASKPTDWIAALSGVLAGSRLSLMYANIKTTGMPSNKVQRSSVVLGSWTPIMANSDSI